MVQRLTHGHGQRPTADKCNTGNDGGRALYLGPIWKKPEQKQKQKDK